MPMSPRIKAKKGRFGVFGLVPTVRILTPANGAVGAGSPAVAFTFTGKATDDLQGDVSANIVWSSDLDGDMGTGASVSPTLTAGVHVVTATVSDSPGGSPTVGNPVTDSITVTVV